MTGCAVWSIIACSGIGSWERGNTTAGRRDKSGSPLEPQAIGMAWVRACLSVGARAAPCVFANEFNRVFSTAAHSAFVEPFAMSAGDTHPAWAASTVRERQSPRASSTGCCTAKKAGPQCFASSPARRVVVKARILRHQGRSFRSAPMTAHLSYLKRDGVTRNSEKAVMFDVGSDCTDDAAFADRCKDDRHHFCFIVSPEDAGEMTDFKVFTRDLARQMKVDLGTRLDWVAVDHWDTVVRMSICSCAASIRPAPTL
jgi:hypothetical protein